MYLQAWNVLRHTRQLRGQLTDGHKLHSVMLVAPGDEVRPKPHDWHGSRLFPGEKVPAGQMVQAAVEPGDTVP
jgi:hypothetical protein